MLLLHDIVRVLFVSLVLFLPASLFTIGIIKNAPMMVITKNALTMALDIRQCLATAISVGLIYIDMWSVQCQEDLGRVRHFICVLPW